MNTPAHDDQRIVMTLDAGGTNLKFSAIRGNALLFAPIYVPSEAHDLARCLHNIVEGFRQVQARLPGPAVAISFAFPGPADYPAGIIGERLPNFPRVPWDGRRAARADAGSGVQTAGVHQ